MIAEEAVRRLEMREGKEGEEKGEEKGGREGGIE